MLRLVHSYYAIASKATLLKPAELSIPTQQFEGMFFKLNLFMMEGVV